MLMIAWMYPNKVLIKDIRKIPAIIGNPKYRDLFFSENFPSVIPINPKMSKRIKNVKLL